MFQTVSFNVKVVRGGPAAENPLVRCAQHPARTADTPCLRCGAFICDWCVKLAPSWGPGLCLDCQTRAAEATPAKVPMTRGFVVVGAAVLLCPFITWNEIVDAAALARESPEYQPTVTAVIAVLVVLLVWNAAAIVLVALRRPRARAVLMGFFALRGLFSLLGVIGSGTTAVGWLPLIIYAALFFYVGWSDDARVMFGPPAGTPSAAESLKRDPD